MRVDLGNHCGGNLLVSFSNGVLLCLTEGECQQADLYIDELTAGYCLTAEQCRNPIDGSDYGYTFDNGSVDSRYCLLPESCSTKDPNIFIDEGEKSCVVASDCSLKADLLTQTCIASCGDAVGDQRYTNPDDNLCRLQSKCEEDDLFIKDLLCVEACTLYSLYGNQGKCVAQCSEIEPTGTLFNDQVSATEWVCS